MRILVQSDTLGFVAACRTDDRHRTVDAAKPFAVLLEQLGFLALIEDVYKRQEWKRIAGPAWKKVLYTFTFPFFMLTYVPISIAALVGKVEWKPIQHGIAKVQEERESA